MVNNRIKERAERLLRISPKVMLSFSKMHSSKKAEMTFNQYQTLVLIQGMGECSVNELAERLGLAQSTTSQLVDRLVIAGLVKREINPNNRRSIIVSLGQEGMRMLHKRTTIMQKGYEKILSMLNEEDQEKFEDAFITLNKIADKLEKIYEK
jgi:MarR family transcriptional regulator, organic hydroperoxide resistance regulator